MKYHRVIIDTPHSGGAAALSKETHAMKVKSSTPTMKDVAREAGVALGTVSKVFNDLPVGESYRLRICL